MRIVGRTGPQAAGTPKAVAAAAGAPARALARAQAGSAASRGLGLLLAAFCFALTGTLTSPALAQARLQQQSEAARVTQAAAPPVPLTVAIPGSARLQAAAVDSKTHRVYVTSRDNDKLFMLDGQSLEVLDSAVVGHQPWGVALNTNTGRLYVANFLANTVSVLDAATLAQVQVIELEGHPTFVRVNPLTNRVFVIDYTHSALIVINGANGILERTVASGGEGAWGLAVNAGLNRVYVSNRDTGDITTLDGNDGWSEVAGQRLTPCPGTGPSPYYVEFNPANDRLYNVCSPGSDVASVNTATVFQASEDGLALLARLAIDNGGLDAGGGIAVDAATGNVFVTSSQANSVSVIGGASHAVVGRVSGGVDPFGVAVDESTRRVYVVNRRGNALTVFDDSFDVGAQGAADGRRPSAAVTKAAATRPAATRPAKTTPATSEQAAPGTPGAAPSSAGQLPDAGRPAVELWLVGGGLALAVVLVAGLWLLLRRRSGPGGPQRA